MLNGMLGRGAGRETGAGSLVRVLVLGSLTAVNRRFIYCCECDDCYGVGGYGPRASGEGVYSAGGVWSDRGVRVPTIPYPP